jgi:hypothetical protein
LSRQVPQQQEPVPLNISMRQRSDGNTGSWPLA